MLGKSLIFTLDGGFLRVLRFPPPIKLTEILLKMALNTINLNQDLFTEKDSVRQ